MSSASSVTERFELPHPSGEGVFVISISHPRRCAVGDVDVPVIFLLDADASFGVASELAHARAFGGLVRDSIVVGIGYDADFLTMLKCRTLDLTPPPSEGGSGIVDGLTGLIGARHGGADMFLRFVLNVVVPEVLARVSNASRDDHILLGHSLGGLFVAYALLMHPEAFSVFGLASPSLWWNKFAVLENLVGFEERIHKLQRKPSVLVSVGAMEQDLPTKPIPGVAMSLEQAQAWIKSARMIDTAREFCAALTVAGLPRVDFVSFEGEDHGSVGPVSLNRAITFSLARNS